MKIYTLEEYEYCLSRGHEPLLSKYIEMDINLRIDIQKEKFGKCVFGRGNITRANQRYYEFVWENKSHICENCLLPLNHYSAVFISHIFTKQGSPEMAHDPRNSNVLCGKCHNKYEFGTESEKEKMLIYPTVSIIKKKLINEYIDRR